MFDPTIGRWTTEDPSGFEAADADLFRYVHNNPTNATDPSGLVDYRLGYFDAYDPQAGDNGAVFWAITWNLRGKNAEKGGYIIQIIQITWEMYERKMDGKGGTTERSHSVLTSFFPEADRPRKALEPRPGREKEKRFRGAYVEAFPIEKGKSMTLPEERSSLSYEVRNSPWFNTLGPGAHGFGTTQRNKWESNKADDFFWVLGSNLRNPTKTQEGGYGPPSRTRGSITWRGEAIYLDGLKKSTLEDEGFKPGNAGGAPGAGALLSMKLKPDVESLTLNRLLKDWKNKRERSSPITHDMKISWEGGERTNIEYAGEWARISLFKKYAGVAFPRE